MRLLKAGRRDSYAEVHGTLGPGHTFHAFQGPPFTGMPVRIDWIICRGAIRAVDAEIFRDGEGGRYPSDHYFASAALELA